ncbi:M23 family metallopeptidase, partial [Candidatus Poribacteria bacterium]|nr:M23 family metallopeptidase [Candidatus Poribacteria bacterium]
MGGYGKLIVIQHSDNFSTRYGHLSNILVEKGQRVKQSHKIGLVGSTGRSTGPHLHFEIRENGKALNPAKILGR